MGQLIFFFEISRAISQELHMYSIGNMRLEIMLLQ